MNLMNLYPRKSPTEQEVEGAEVTAVLSYRVSWCRSTLVWTVEQNWNHVIFSDEINIVLGKDRQIYVGRTMSARLSWNVQQPFAYRLCSEGVNLLVVLKL